MTSPLIMGVPDPGDDEDEVDTGFGFQAREMDVVVESHGWFYSDRPFLIEPTFLNMEENYPSPGTARIFNQRFKDGDLHAMMLYQIALGLPHPAFEALNAAYNEMDACGDHFCYCECRPSIE